MKQILSILIILISQSLFSQETIIEEDNTIYHMLDIDVRPKYSEGREVLAKFVARHFNGGIVEDKKGRIIVRLLIEKDGTVSETDVLEDLGELSRLEILRVFKKVNGKWIPGENKGKIVRSYFIYFINWG